MKGKITLEGVVFIKTINTPKYFNKLSKEIYSLFHSDVGLDYATVVMAGQLTEQVKMPKEIRWKFDDIYKNYYLNSGNMLDTLECKVDFSPKDKFHINGNYIAEMKLQDGIIKELNVAKNPFRPQAKKNIANNNPEKNIDSN